MFKRFLNPPIYLPGNIEFTVEDGKGRIYSLGLCCPPRRVRIA